MCQCKGMTSQEIYWRLVIELAKLAKQPTKKGKSKR